MILIGFVFIDILKSRMIGVHLEDILVMYQEMIDQFEADSIH